jgi:hypothetical protein
VSEETPAVVETNQEVPAVEPEQVAAETVEPEKEQPKLYTKEEVDRIAAKIKKNTRYIVKREFEEFNRGRESVLPKPAEREAEPVREQFITDAEYYDARAAFVGKKAGAEAVASASKAAAEAAAAEAADKTISTFREKTLEKFPDINERLEDIGNMPIYRGVQQAISESELGPEIFNELVSKPSEFERLMKMSESAAIREIGKLEARLEPDKKSIPTETKRVSNAPAPIRPVTPKAVSIDDEPSHDKPEEWAAWRNRQIAKRRAGSK